MKLTATKSIDDPKGIVLGLGCVKQVGKDTAAHYLISRYNFRRIAFADALKEEMHLMLEAIGLDYDESNKELYRPMMIAYGQFRRKIDPYYWLNLVLDFITKHQDVNWVITDVRYPNEAEALKKIKGILIRINRDNSLLPEPSEEIGKNIKVDYEVDNNGTFEELHFQLDKIMKEINGKLH